MQKKAARARARQLMARGTDPSKLDMPQRVDDELCDMLARYHPFWMNLHFNHPSEITPEVSRAVDRLSRAGNSGRQFGEMQTRGPEPGPVTDQAAAAFLAAFLRGFAAVFASALGAAAFLATFLRPFGSGAASAGAARSVSMTSAIGAQSPAR